MVEDSGHELPRQRRQVVLAAGVIETVHALVLRPSREMEMAAVARLVGPGLGREGSVAPVLQGDPANGFPVHDVVVGRLESGRVTDGELLLTPAELRIVLLDG